MSIQEKSVNALRVLSIDAINKANSGHPGMPMGAAPMAYTLFNKFMQVNPKVPNWINRDRFVLSAGHGSMLLYALIHLSGYDLPIEELKNFRQWGSKTPGHPEFGHTVGVDSTSGPLGQGIATAVGMAMAEKHLAAKYNEQGLSIIDHYTYAICGDGCLMEGVSGEASSFAGHQKLGKMIVLYDSNDITLDGTLNRSFSESVRERYISYGWQYIQVLDGNSIEEIEKAIKLAKQEKNRPSIIEVKTVIGYGAPHKEGTNDVHGSPIGEDEAKLAKERYGWTEENFVIPQEVYDHYRQNVCDRGINDYEKWERVLSQYKLTHGEKHAEFMAVISGESLANLEEILPKFEAGSKAASRASSGDILNIIAQHVPNLFGGSADLFSSNKTYMKGAGDFSATTPEGKNIWFGVREFAMAALCNGIALHGGLKTYGSTFLVFADYLRGALRLSALMGLPVIQVFTHDSIAVGEDGPTHEPVEQIANLRDVPNLNVIRPADSREVKGAWIMAMTSKTTPTALIMSRQNLVVEEGTCYLKAQKGGYVIHKAEKEDAIVVATGSEVNLAMSAARELAKEGIYLTVVSMPCVEVYNAQSDEYKESVLPMSQRNRIAIEMGVTSSWYKFVGLDGKVIGIDTFGASAPGEIVMEKYGFSTSNVVAEIKKYLKK